MKPLSVLLLALALRDSVFAACQNPTVRMEWHQLSDGQKSAYVNAIVALTKRPLSGQLQDPNRISFYDFVATHTNNAYWAHGNAQFYPYHRAMMWQFDRALQSVGWSQGLVYWDWSAMSQNWWTSDIFSAKYFGAVRSNDPDNCVVDGAFAKDKYQVSKNPPTNPITGPRKFSGNPTCLRRCGEVGYAVTDATAITAPLLSATTYTAFRGDDTSNYHAVGHETIGGSNCDMGNPSFSPNDPIFYFHHGLVDKTWWRWQQSCPGSNVMDYEGLLASGAANPIALGTLPLDSWSWWTVNDVLDTEGDLLCYTYSKSGGDLPIPPQRGCEQKPTPPPAPSPTKSSTKPNNSGTGIVGNGINDPVVTATTAPSTVKASPFPTSRAVIETDPVLTDTWMAQLLISLVQTKSFTFNVPKVKVGGRDSSSNMTSGTTTATSFYNTTEVETASISNDTSTYTIDDNINGSKLVTLPDGTEVTVAEGYTISRVYQTNVQAINDATKKPRMFHATVDAIPYVRAACAPKNVTAGSHPCYLAYPRRVSLKYAEHMQMDLTVTSNNDNIVAMSIDQFNCDCERNFSPSQMRFQ